MRSPNSLDVSKVSLSIRNRTRRPIPRVKFEQMAEHVLSPSYEISLVLCGNALMRRLNRTYRGKDRPTNVLAFPLEKNSGEIFINLSYLKNFSVPHLFIHALLHLKGMEHSDTMEKTEQKILHGASNRSGY